MKIIAFYHFAVIAHPARFCRDVRDVCEQHGLLGRVYVAAEGINGTLAGQAASIENFCRFLLTQPGFAGADIKTDTHDAVPFERLVVKVRPEIVALKAADDIDVTRERGRSLSPAQWRAVLESDQDYVLVDVRNRYETAIGHFENALCPPVDHFYDFPAWLEKCGIDPERKVLMYCTGGIRCEKFSLLMKKKGYQQVFQLKGGILNYARRERGKHFRGKCFVFDDRLSIPVNEDGDAPISRCAITGEACDRYVNCANLDCNKLFVCSPAGAKKYDGCCSETCLRAEWRRPFNPNDIYTPTRRWYNYKITKPARSKVS